MLLTALLFLATVEEPMVELPKAATAKAWNEELGRNNRLTVFGLSAMANGMSWANTELEIQKRPQLFCEPKNLALQSDQYVDVFRRYLKKHPEEEQLHVALVLMGALKVTFPCPTNR